MLGRFFLETLCHLALDLRGGERLVVEVALAEILRALGGMGVRVDDARQHQLAVQVDRVGLRPDQCADGLIGADSDYRIAAKRECLRDGALRILGVNATVKQNDVCWQIRSHGDETKSKQ